MDPYRFFHPHHNPRLRKLQLRHQEVSELELAAKELQRASRRALVRANEHDSQKTKKILEEGSHALDFLVDLFQTLNQITPEDSEEELQKLLLERKNAPGWEAWRNLVRTKLSTKEIDSIGSSVLPKEPPSQWVNDLGGSDKQRDHTREKHRAEHHPENSPQENNESEWREIHLESKKNSA